LAAASVLIDMAKVAAVYLIVDNMIPGSGFLAGFAAVIGHDFPVWLKGRGGKGVAATFGFMIAASPWLFVVCAAAWLSCALLTRLSSLSALVMLTIAPAAAFLIGLQDEVVFAVAVLALLGVYTHKENIKRLVGGTEDKINLRRKKS